VLDIVACLPRDRYSITVACPTASVIWRELQGDSDVRLHAISPRRRPGMADVATLGRLLRLASRADVVHAHSAKAGFVARAASFATGRRQRCCFTPNAWSFHAARGAESRLYRSLERLAAHWCARIVAVSSAERTDGLAAGIGRPDQYIVVPNGIEVARHAVARAPECGRIAMVGRLTDQKRPDLAVRALATVRPTHPEAHLQLIGDGPRRAEIEALARSLGIADAVEITGHHDDVAPLLARAEIALLATDYEGWPLVLMEAMAAGLPVVATAVGGVPEIVEDDRTGILTPPDDPGALAAALERLLSDSALARTMGEAGAARAVERFDRTRTVERLMALYESLADSANVASAGAAA